MAQKHVERYFNEPFFKIGRESTGMVVHFTIAAKCSEQGELATTIKDLRNLTFSTKASLQRYLGELADAGLLKIDEVGKDGLFLRLYPDMNTVPMTSAELIANRKKKPPKPQAVAAPSGQSSLESTKKFKPESTILARELLNEKERQYCEANGVNTAPWPSVGVFMILREYAEAGYSEADLRYMLDNSPAYTKNAFHMTLSNRDKPKTTFTEQQNKQSDDALRGFIERQKTQSGQIRGSVEDNLFIHRPESVDVIDID